VTIRYSRCRVDVSPQSAMMVSMAIDESEHERGRQVVDQARAGSALEVALGRAHALVSRAAHGLLPSGDADVDVEQFSASMQCSEVAHLLEACGASPDADALSDDSPSGEPGELLATAAEVLDEIPVDQRPTRLVSARGHLAAAILSLPDTTIS